MNLLSDLSDSPELKKKKKKIELGIQVWVTQFSNLDLNQFTNGPTSLLGNSREL